VGERSFFFLADKGISGVDDCNRLFFQTGTKALVAASTIMMALQSAVLFGSVAGVFVDRWSKKGSAVVATNVLRGSLVFGNTSATVIDSGLGACFKLPVGFGILLGLSFLILA